MGEKWDIFIKNATDDPDILAEYERGSELSDQWPEEDLILYNFSKGFIEAAHRYYLERKDEIND